MKIKIGWEGSKPSAGEFVHHPGYVPPQSNIVPDLFNPVTNRSAVVYENTSESYGMIATIDWATWAVNDLWMKYGLIATREILDKTSHLERVLMSRVAYLELNIRDQAAELKKTKKLWMSPNASKEIRWARECLEAVASHILIPGSQPWIEYYD
jgi:hypothetical protein